MEALDERVFKVLSDDTHVYPGHGDDTTLGRERPHLGEWWARGYSGPCPAGGEHDTVTAQDGLVCRKCEGRFG